MRLETHPIHPIRAPSTGETGGENSGEEIPPEKTVALILQPGGLGDEGWNDASWAGLKRMMDEHGIGGVTVETSATADTGVLYPGTGGAGLRPDLLPGHLSDSHLHAGLPRTIRIPSLSILPS